MRTRTLVLSILTLASCLQAVGQYSIDWFSVAGGGGTSTGGVFSISGTVGQGDAGDTMRGGTYTVDGGFFSLVASAPSSGVPLLSISRSGANVIISWPSPSTGYELEQNTNLATTNWVNVGTPPTDDGSNKFIILTPSVGTTFYRLKSQ